MNRTAAESALEILRTIILHDGGRGSEDYDATILFEYRQKALDIIERACGQDAALEASEKLRKQIYDFWHKDRQGFGQASSQAIIRNWIEKVLAERSCGETAWVSHAVKMIADERQRQVSKEGWTPEHDNEHTEGDLALAAACYAAPIPIRGEVTSTVQCGCREASCEHTFGTIEKKEWKDPWPWDKKWDKRKKHDRIRQLAIAGALIAAEIDRLNRALPSPPTGRTEEKCKS